MPYREQPFKAVYTPPKYNSPDWDGSAEVITILVDSKTPLAYLVWTDPDKIAYFPARQAPAWASPLHNEAARILREGALLGRDVVEVRDELLANEWIGDRSVQDLPTFFAREFPPLT